MFHKSFTLELQDSLSYPSAETICDAVARYAADGKENLEWVSREKPVSFYLDKILYIVSVPMLRGGYYLLCEAK